MRILGNFGTIRVGATAGIAFYWNRQWTVKYKAASATLTKTVKLSNEDLAAFYVKGKCESGSLVLDISQGSETKKIDISNIYNQKIDMSNFNPGLIKLVLKAKSAKNMNVFVGWRR